LDGADLATFGSRFLRRQVLSRYLAEGVVEHRNVVLDAEPDVRILIGRSFFRDAEIRRFERHRLVAICLRHLHPAVPHSMIDITAPEDDQARLEFVFFGDKRHGASMMFLSDFCADSVEVYVASY
jgi:hypothetical protein